VTHSKNSQPSGQHMAGPNFSDAMRVALKGDHLLQIDKPLAPLREQVWSCKCGKWTGRVPEVGAFGCISSKSRAATTTRAHYTHVKSTVRAALSKAQGATK